jgi:hypothetical protein
MAGITGQELDTSLFGEVNGTFTVTKSGKDANKIYTTVNYYRPNGGTLYMTSVLSGGTSPNYTTQTETYYAANGTTVVMTKSYALTYDSDGIVSSETCT